MLQCCTISPYVMREKKIPSNTNSDFPKMSTEVFRQTCFGTACALCAVCKSRWARSKALGGGGHENQSVTQSCCLVIKGQKKKTCGDFEIYICCLLKVSDSIVTD